MAHIQKHTKINKTLENHYDREEMTQEELDHRYFKSNVNKAKTNQNYKMVQSQVGLKEMIASRLEGVYKAPNQKNLVESFSIVMTLPCDRKYTPKEQIEFFQRSFEFCQSKFGKENIVQGYVHNDETTPHIHIIGLPIVECDKTTKKGVHYSEKLCAKEVLNVELFRGFHSEYQAYMDKHLSYNVRVVNEALELFEGLPHKGSDDIKALKNGEAKSNFKRAIEEYENLLDDYNDLVDKANRVCNHWIEKSEQLQRENEILKKAWQKEKYGNMEQFYRSEEKEKHYQDLLSNGM